MSKVVDLTGLSRATTKIKEWVLGQRTHWIDGTIHDYTMQGNITKQVRVQHYSDDVLQIKWDLTSIEGESAGTRLFSASGGELTIYEDNILRVTTIYDGTSSTVTIYSRYDDAQIYGDFQIGINVSVTKLPEIYIPDTIAREDESMRILRYIANPHIINMSGSASERAIPKELYDAETDSFKMFGFSHDYPFVMIDHDGTVCPIYFDREGEQYIPRIWTVSGGASRIDISNGIVINIDLSY